MDALKHLLPRPPMELTPEMRAAFDKLFVASQHAPEGHIAYDLPAPKWQFLCYLAENKAILLHGSSDPTISEFVPQQPLDLHAFGAQNGVYATSDGIWPMFYAILDRQRHPMMLHNAAIRVRADGRDSDPYYYFSITRDALDQRPYQNGVVYILPRTTFNQEPAQPFGGAEIIIPQWVSAVAVKPLARLDVAPDDFPFLAAVRGHDDERLMHNIKTNPAGFPWAD